MKQSITYLLMGILCFTSAAHAQTDDGTMVSVPMVTEWVDDMTVTVPVSMENMEDTMVSLPAGDSGNVTMQPVTATGFIEAGGNYSSVSKNQGNWAGQYLRGEVQTDENNRWRGSYVHQRKFRENGHYGTVGNVHVVDEDYYTDVTVGAGQGDMMPQYRVDGFLNRKWLEDRNLVTTFGLGAVESPDDHSEVSAFLGASYYFAEPWIVQGGVRVSEGDPGDIISPSAFIAVTQGRKDEHFVTLRYGFGREAYQIIGQGNSISDFNSQQVSLNWRQWMAASTKDQKGWGFDATSEYYDNPNYDRKGLTLGVFKEF